MERKTRSNVNDVRRECCICTDETVTGDKVSLNYNPKDPVGQQVVRAHAHHFSKKSNDAATILRNIAIFQGEPP